MPTSPTGWCGPRRRSSSRRRRSSVGSTTLADEIGASVVVLDPALPVGLLGPRLRHPYAVVLHGAEITVPGRLPGSNLVLRHVLRGAELVIAAGGYPLAEGERAAGRSLPSVLVPPGVDTERFRPLDDAGAGVERDSASGSRSTGRWSSASAGWCRARGWTC